MVEPAGQCKSYRHHGPTASLKAVPLMNINLSDLCVVPSLGIIFSRHLLMETKVCERRPMIDSVMGKLKGERGDAQRGLVRVVDGTFIQ